MCRIVSVLRSERNPNCHTTVRQFEPDLPSFLASFFFLCSLLDGAILGLGLGFGGFVSGFGSYEVDLKLHAVAPGGPPEGHHGRSMVDGEKK
jgi:hypothetical protein